MSPRPPLDHVRPGTLRGKPGFFRVGQTKSGQWWFWDADDQAIFLRAVAAVNRSGWGDGRPSRPGRYATTVQALYGEDEQRFVRSVIGRLDRWHVNALGAWAAQEFFDQGLAYTEVVEFRKVGPCIHSGDVLLPDVFDPAWRDAADHWARQICSPRALSRDFVGYFTDHQLGWAQPCLEQPQGVVPADRKQERPSLLQVCLSLEPTFRAYHAAWEFVLAPRQGSLDQLAADWQLDAPHREAVRQATQSDLPLLADGYLRDQRRFAREFARRYFETCSSSIRHYDPNHLVLGCRFAGNPGLAVLKACVPPHVDVLSTRPEREMWDRGVQACSAANGMPVLLTDMTWADVTFARRPMKRETRRLTSIERMLGKGRSYVERVITQKAAVGYEWACWADADEDEPPFGRGLVHIDDREAREHTELLAEINSRAETLRLRAR